MQLLINIDVDDLQRAVTFYTGALDMRVTRYLFDGSVAELTGAACRIHLLEKPVGTLPSPDAVATRDYRRHWTPVHLDFVVEDIAVALARAVAAGAVLEGQIEAFIWGRQAVFSDPFGHGFCLIQFTGEGYAAVVCPRHPDAEEK